MATNYIADTFSINPFDVYNAVFGYRALPFPTMLNLNNYGIRNPAERLSKLGAVLFKKDKNGQEAFCPVTISYQGKKYSLPYSTIAITLGKNIKETVMVGRKGTVKELISKDDYKFTIRGVILSDDDLPEDDLSSLNELFDIDAPVSLENAFSEIFLQEDNKVVIKRIDLPDMKGVSGAQAYTIEVASDTILELEVQ